MYSYQDFGTWFRFWTRYAERIHSDSMEISSQSIDLILSGKVPPSEIRRIVDAIRTYRTVLGEA